MLGAGLLGRYCCALAFMSMQLLFLLFSRDSNPLYIAVFVCVCLLHLLPLNEKRTPWHGRREKMCTITTQI
jgi:uncharacterized membrane protein